MNQEELGKLIKDIRVKNNLSQKEFGDIFNVTYQAVSKWENGKNIPDIMILKQISEKYNVPMEKLVGSKKKNNKSLYLIIFVGLLIVCLLLILIFTKNNFEFKTLSASCSNFTVTGSLSYNKNKSAIYISHVDYCGDDDSNTYESINCSLYENDNDVTKEISSCNEKNNITLENFLKDVSFSVDNYKNMCKKYTKDSLYLLIEANKNGKVTSYKIPLVLEDNC